MDSIYINVFDEQNGFFSLTIESLIVVHVYEICKSEWLQLKLKFLEREIQEPHISLNFSQISYESIEHIPSNATFCLWPLMVAKDSVIGGLCSVVRQIVRSSKNANVEHLLGFREGCLMACSEISVWTKFCEIDMPSLMKDLLQRPSISFIDNNTFKIPENVGRFEYHMAQPVRIHNIYKVAGTKITKKNCSSNIPISELDLPHAYGEGPYMTLFDVVLYPCFQIFFNLFENEILIEKLKLTHSWFTRMESNNKLELKVSEQCVKRDFLNVVESCLCEQSFYTGDLNRGNGEKKTYTKQSDIEYALDLIQSSVIKVKNDLIPYGFEINFDWNNIPLAINPHGGSIPKKRAERKSHQLENLAKAVLKIAENGNSYRIVDFCSGSGHLGILLAYLLPQCEIILVENKERSLARAKDQIARLKLPNIMIVQSNLDYFSAEYDIGISLHACGVATDLVLENCINKRAHFVCCACCYGGIRVCHSLTYPRSEAFGMLNLGIGNYLNLAHAADQTHDVDNAKTEQGYVCMDVIDTDRKLYAESFGYRVFLGKLQPTSCTNKNNLLVGIFEGSRKHAM